MTSPSDAARYLAKEAGIPLNGNSPPFTDLGNAERLVALHGSDLLYCHDWKKWLAWDGTRFAEDRNGEVYRRATQTVRNMYQQGADLAAKAAAATDPTEAIKLSEFSDAIQRWARKSEDRRKVEALIALATSRDTIPILPTDLDKDPWLLNCPNGTINLRTGELRDHDKADRITKTTAVEYNPAAECPLWEGLLDLVLDHDANLISFLQRAVGYSLTGTVGDQVIFVLYGTGRNGKSTFLEALMRILGDYSKKAPPNLLMIKKGEVHPTERTVLYGSRFVPAVETEEGRRLNETAVKELTGGDTIQARRMHENFWQFQPTHHLWLATNHKPLITGTDLGIWRRIRLVPFGVEIADDVEDPTYPEMLKAEWAGILAWAVRGCLEWQEVGLQSPPIVQEATKEYKADMDTLADFIAVHCIKQDGASVTSGDLYARYKLWSQSAGERTMSITQLSQILTERGYKRTRQGNSRTRGWVGLALRGIEAQQPLHNDADTADTADGNSSLLDPRGPSLRGDLPETVAAVSAVSANGSTFTPRELDPWESEGTPIEELDL